MIHERFQIDTVPGVCVKFVESFESGTVAELDEFETTRESAWTGDRLFLGYFWKTGEEKLVVDFRFQFLPVEKVIFIGSIEVDPDLRGSGVATAVVNHLEKAISLEEGDWKIRLFAQKGAAGFWEKLGYERESDVRFLTKEIT